MVQDAITLSVAAVNSHRALRISYEDAKGEGTQRTVIPYRVVRAGYGCVYVHAYCGVRRAKRVFRTDRIHSMAMGEEEVPAGWYSKLCPDLLQHNICGVVLAQVQA